MRLSDLFPRAARPTRVAVVYWNRETALAAAEAARANGAPHGVSLVGPLDQILGAGTAVGAWAVVVQPGTYEQCRRVVRALRRPWRRRQADGGAQPRRPSALAAGS